MLEKYDRSRHNAEEVKNLLGMAVGRPEDNRLQKLLDVVYDIEGYQLYISTEKERITGVIGIDASALPYGWILHLAVDPDNRKQGKGREIINEAMEMLSLTGVGLETDQDAVDFYRTCGFTAIEIHSQWPGIHRYRCIKGNLPSSVLEYYGNKKLVF